MAEEEYISIMSRLDSIEKKILTDKEVLTLDEAAVYTGWKKSHLYRLTSQRAIPFYKPMGGNIFFKRSELDEWLCSNRQATEAEISSAASTHIAIKNIKK